MILSLEEARVKKYGYIFLGSLGRAIRFQYYETCNTWSEGGELKTRKNLYVLFLGFLGL